MEDCAWSSQVSPSLGKTKILDVSSQGLESALSQQEDGE